MFILHGIALMLVSLLHACRQFPGCGNIVTFSQFLFIAVEGFIFEANFGRKRPAIPIRYSQSERFCAAQTDELSVISRSV